MSCAHVMKDRTVEFRITGTPQCPWCEIDRLRAENAELRDALRKFVTEGLLRAEANAILAKHEKAQ